MYYLNNFLYIFSVRFGSRVIGYIEIAVYFYLTYFMITTYGFTELTQSMVIICLASSGVLSVLMLMATLQGHESSGIILTYLISHICTASYVLLFYMYYLVTHWRYVHEHGSLLISVGAMLALIPSCQVLFYAGGAIFYAYDSVD